MKKLIALIFTALLLMPQTGHCVALNRKAITLLSTTSGVDMKTAATKRVLLSVPTGRTAYITHVVVRNTTASLAGGTSYAFGSTATCNDWKTGIDLSSMTSANSDTMLITPTAKFSYIFPTSAPIEFGMYITTGATAVGTATIDVFGYYV